MKKKIFAICGSTRQNSSNLQLLKTIASLSGKELELEIFTSLSSIPHFNPDDVDETTPSAVKSFRQKINQADGVIICTPEYVFSLPGSLKNSLEWCVSTSTFSGKPTAIITASSLGEKAHESLQLVMKTIEAKMTPQTQLLISGVRAKLNNQGEITDETTLNKIKKLISSFTELLYQ